MNLSNENTDDNLDKNYSQNEQVDLEQTSTNNQNDRTVHADDNENELSNSTPYTQNNEEVQHQYNQSIIQNHYYQKQEHEDPTIPYLLLVEQINFDEELLEDKADEIKDNRVLLIDCLDQELSNYAVVDLIDELCLSNDVDYRQLSFKSRHTDRTDLDLAFFLNQKKKSNSEYLIVIELLDNEAGQTFFNSSFNKLLPSTYIRNSLIEQNKYIICTFSSPKLRDKYYKQKVTDHLGYWHIPYKENLNLILQQHFSKEETEKLCEYIKAQDKAGLFGYDAETLYQTIHTKLQEDKESLKTEIYKNKDKLESQGSLKKKARITPQNLFKHQNISLLQPLLYIATFLPKLKIVEFREIASILLKEEIGSRIITIEKKDETGQIFEHKKQIQQNLWDWFCEDEDKYRQQARLMTAQAEYSSRVIVFQEPYLQEPVRAYFKSQYGSYIERQFGKLQQAQLLTKKNISGYLENNLIKLMAEIAAGNSTYFGERLLMEVGIGTTLSVETSTSQTSLKKDIKDFWKASGVQSKSVQRLADLIKAMLVYGQLQQTIRTFFDNLIHAWGQHELALALLQKIHYPHPHLDHLFWVKTIFTHLNKKDKPLKENKNITKPPFHYLIDLGIQSHFNIYPFLEEIKMWQEMKVNKNSRPANLRDTILSSSLNYLYHYATTTAFAVAASEWGHYPSKYVLFTRLSVASDESDSKIMFLIKWLFHPYLDKLLYQNRFYNPKKGEIRSNADLIAYWFLILWGDKKEEDLHQETRFILATIVLSIKTHTNKQIQRALRQEWTKRKNYYAQKLIETSRKEEIQRKEWKLKRDNVKRLVVFFKRTNKS